MPTNPQSNIALRPFSPAPIKAATPSADELMRIQEEMRKVIDSLINAITDLRFRVQGLGG